jgi:hypothetical protein
MQEANRLGKGRIVTESTYEKSLAQQKNGEKRRKHYLTSTPSEELVDHNAPTYVEEQLDVMDGWRIF